MKNLLLSLLCVCAIVVMVVPCQATAVNGVEADGQSVNLPQDANRWYISVVGNANDAQYREVLGWFDNHTGLRDLKAQVHFCPVASDTPVYQERYAGNVKGLPTVRMQKADGSVMCEAAGKKLPSTATALHKLLVAAVHADGRILPWRREMERRCPPGCVCQPKSEPVKEMPPAVGDGKPAVDDADEGLPPGVIILLCVGALVIGGGAGVAVQLKQTYLKK